MKQGKHIDRERFEKVLGQKGYSKRFLAKAICNGGNSDGARTSLVRSLKNQAMDAETLWVICKTLNVDPRYITGQKAESDNMPTFEDFLIDELESMKTGGTK